MPKIIGLSNQKGGVGKTTLTKEIGICLAQLGHLTLLIDLDPQANLTRGLTDEEKPGAYHAFCGEPFELHLLRENLHLLHGSGELSLIERNLIGEIDAYTRIKNILTDERFNPFDYILIDTPPSVGVMTLNALAAADFLAVVINPAIYTMQGTNTLLETYIKVKENLNPKLSIIGAFVNELDTRPVIFREIMEELKEHFGDLLVNFSLSRSIKIEEAIPKQVGVVELGKSKVKTEIEAMTQDLIVRSQR
jgi:chromosome partitioning protein